MTKLNLKEILFGLKTTKFKPKEYLCFYSISFMIKITFYHENVLKLENYRRTL